MRGEGSTEVILPFRSDGLDIPEDDTFVVRVGWYSSFHMTAPRVARVIYWDESPRPVKQSKPLKRRSVSRACKAYLRASEPGIRYRTQYRAKMRYWKREATQKPTLWAVEHGARSHE